METAEIKKGSVVTLKGRDVRSQIVVTDTPLKYQKGPNKDKEYFIGTHLGIGFTITPEFKTAWDAGDIAEVTLVKNDYERKVEDPENPGMDNMKTIKRDSWNMSGYITHLQLEKVISSENKIKVLEAKGDAEVAKISAAATPLATLTESEVAKLKAKLLEVV